MVESAEMVRPSVVRTSCMSNGSCMSNAGTGCAGTEVCVVRWSSCNEQLLPACNYFRRAEAELTNATHSARPQTAPPLEPRLYQ